MPEAETERTLDDERLPLVPSSVSVAPATVSVPSKTLPEAGTDPPPAGEALGPDLPTVPRAVYQVGEEIARGGLGRIYRAQDLRLDRVVAIKELLNPSASNQRRFLREIEVTVRLEHPNIVSIHEAGRWPDGQPFYSMNYVRGSTLLSAIEQRDSLAERLTLLPALISVADAVAYAHDKGVVHRDLKPANILVGGFGETVVIDWGLAKYANVQTPEPPLKESSSDGHTRYGAVVGTPPYMPPEQARGEAVDASADVYALGAILYHLLSGRTPFDNIASEQLLEAIQHEAPQAIAKLSPDVAPDLLAIVEKAMAKNRADRYRTAREMVEELRLFAAGRLVAAYSYSMTDLAVRFLRRHLGSVVTATVAMVVLLISASYGVSRIRGERDTAQHHALEADDARDRAEARSRALIVAQALALTDSDPTEAVARLKHLQKPTHGAISVAARAQELGVAEAILSNAGNPLACAALSADGRWAAAAGEREHLMLWSLEGPSPSVPFGDAQPRALIGHTEKISDCVFSPDGQQLASTGYDGQVILWSVSDATQRLLPAPGGTMRSLRYSQDGSRLVGVSASGTVRQWWLAGSEFRDVEGEATRKPILQYAGDGQRLLLGPHEGKLRVWSPNLDAESQLVLSPVLSSAVNTAKAIDSQRVLLGTESGDVYAWNLATNSVQLLANLGGALASLDVGLRDTVPVAAAATMNGDVFRLDLDIPAAERLTRHGERISAVRVGGDGRFVASASWDKLVHLVDLQTKTLRVLRGHRDVVGTLEFSTDGRHLLSGSWDNTLRLWPVDEDLQRARKVLLAHSVGVHGVRFSPNGKMLVSGGHDNRVRLWNLTDGTSQQLEGHNDHVFRTLFSNDGRWVASSSDDMTVRLWNTKTGFKRVLVGHQADVEEIAFSPDDAWLLSGSEDGTARLWDIARGSAIVLPHARAVTNVAFSPGGKRFATASRNGQVRLYNVPTKLQPTLTPERVFEYTGEAWAIDFSAQGNWFASADLSGALEARQLDTDRVVQLGPVPGATIAKFSFNERWLAVAGRGGQLWLCEPSEALCRLLRSGHSLIHTLAFSRDSMMLFAAGGDALLYAWDVISGEHRVYQGHRAPIFDLDVSPDGSQVATASADETVRLWPVLPLPQASSFEAFLAQLTKQTVAQTETGLYPAETE